MKKWIALLLAAVFVLALIGCGSKQEKDTAEKETQQTEQTTPSQTAETPEPATEPDAVTPTAPAAQEPEPTPEPEPEATEEPTPEPEEQWEPLGKVELTPISLPKEYTVTEIGSFEDPEHRITYRTDQVLIKRMFGQEVETPDVILNCFGEEIPGGPYVRCISLDNGYSVIVKESDDINCRGLIDTAGEFLIQTEAAIIKKLQGDSYNDSDRFLYVIYSTGEVQSEADMFFYITDSAFSFGGPKEGDKLYAGYGKIYDLETKRFIDGITVTNGKSSAVRHLGDYFALLDSDGSTAIYDCNGQKTIQFAPTAQIQCGINYVIASNDYKCYEIYSGKGELLYRSEDQLKPINGSCQYVVKTHYDYDTNVTTTSVLDYYGNPCFSIEGNRISVSEEHGGVFLIQDDHTYRLIDITGAEILSTDNYIEYKRYGCWSYSYEVDEGRNYVLILPDGKTVTDNQWSINNFIVMNKTGDGITQSIQYEILSLNDPDHPVIIESDSVHEIADGLVEFRSNRKYGVYDLFSGKELIAPEYTNILVVYGNIYAEKDNVWTVFKLTLN